MHNFRCPQCGADMRRVILARLESRPAGCPVCRAALLSVLASRRDARVDPVRYDGDDVNRRAEHAHP